MAPNATERESSPLTVDLVQELLYRRDVAQARHRSRLARDLGLADVEMTAVTHLLHQGELTTSQIGALLDLSSGGSTALVQRLERAGVVRRRPHPNDGRSALISLTREAAGRILRAEAGFRGSLAEAIAALPDDGPAAVSGFLGRLADLTETLAQPPQQAEARRRYQPVPSLWG